MVNTPPEPFSLERTCGTCGFVGDWKKFRPQNNKNELRECLNCYRVRVIHRRTDMTEPVRKNAKKQPTYTLEDFLDDLATKMQDKN